MSEQQNNQPARRGRNGGRGNTRNYADPARIKQAEADQDKIRKQLEDNEKRAQNAPKPKVDVNKFIQEGKAVLNKFFLSFEAKNRSNVVVENDEHMPHRVVDFYKDRIESEARHSTEYLNDNTLPEQHVRKFRAGIDAAVAIKLYHSSPEYEQGMMDQLSYLKTGKAIIPEKSSVIINQLGKTDLPNGNKLRVSQQGLLSKRFMVRSIFEYLGRDAFFAECSNANASGFTNVHLANFVQDHFNLMVDTSRSGLRSLRELGKDYFLRKSKENIEINLLAGARNAGANLPFRIKLPEFNFKENGNSIADVVAYLRNPIFDQTIFQFPDLNTWINIVCSLTFQCASLTWLRDPNRNMSVIDNNFNNTFIGNITFQGLMVASGIWSINAFIDDKDLNDLFGDVVHQWNTVSVPIYRNYIKFKEVAFSEYGTEAQLIEVYPTYEEPDGFNYHSISHKARAETALQTSETSAIFGVMSKFVKSVRFSSDFKINYNSNNKNILREFLKSDLV